MLCRFQRLSRGWPKCRQVRLLSHWQRPLISSKIVVALSPAGIMDFEFSPFDDNLLLSASEDTTLKLWQIPSDGLTQHLKDLGFEESSMIPAQQTCTKRQGLARAKRGVPEYYNLAAGCLRNCQAVCCLQDPLFTLEGHGKKVPRGQAVPKSQSALGSA